MAVFWILVLIACAFVLWWIMVLDQRRLEANVRVWKTVARELGLDFRGDETERSMQGTLNGVPVLVEFERKRRRVGKTTRVEEKTRFLAGGNGRIPRSLAVRKDTFGRAFGRLMYGSDEEIGDDAFDPLVELPELDAAACAALSSDAREQLSELLQIGGEVSDGSVLCEPGERAHHDAKWLHELSSFTTRLAAKLDVAPGFLHEQLAHNAIHDPSPGVRLRNIRFLAEPSTRTPPAVLVATARALLSDRTVPVRLWAAKQLGHEGSEALVALASTRWLAIPVRIEALRALAEIDAVELPELLPSLLPPIAASSNASPSSALPSSAQEQGSPELACAALAIIGEKRFVALATDVVECTSSEHAAVRGAALSALGSLAPPGAEILLTRALADPSADVQSAAAEALGLVGSVAAVEPLLPLTRGLGRAALRRSARAAIASIQSRLGDVDAGRLSLAEDTELAGAVALADALEESRGALSLEEASLEEASLGEASVKEPQPRVRGAQPGGAPRSR